jgi:hypothetical protein
MEKSKRRKAAMNMLEGSIWDNRHFSCGCRIPDCASGSSSDRNPG